MDSNAYEILIEQLELKSNVKYRDIDSWEAVCNACDFLPVYFSRPFIDYQIEYLKSFNYEIFDLSLVLVNDNRLCGILPLCLKKNNEGHYSLDSFVNYILEPIFLPEVSITSINKICNKIYSLIQRLKEEYSIDMISLRGKSNHNNISVLQRLFLRNGASISVEFESCIDMSQDIDQIKSNFRKSYKSLVNQGSKIWQITTFEKDNITETEWQDFKMLHIKESGRQTRSDETWELQLKNLRNGFAYYISLRNSEAELVGGAYFLVTKYEAIYGVAAYRRDLFDKPLGHVIQYYAIKKNKELGIKWYKIGERPFKHLNPSVSDKEIDIAVFKEGFSTNLLPVLIFNIRK